MKINEVLDDANMMADMINLLISKNIDVIGPCYSDQLDSWVDGYIEYAVADDDILFLGVLMQDANNPDKFLKRSTNIFAADYRLEKTSGGKWEISHKRWSNGDKNEAV